MKIKQFTDVEMFHLAGAVAEYVDIEAALIQRAKFRLIDMAEQGHPVYYASFRSKDPIPRESVQKFINSLGFKAMVVAQTSKIPDPLYVCPETGSMFRMESMWQGGVVYKFHTLDKKEIEKFVELSRERTEDSSNDVHMVAKTNRGWQITRVGKGGEALERSNYSDKILASFDHIANTFCSPDPPGRLVILHGEPGTGKTYFIRGLLEEMKGVKCLLVPARYAVKLEDPEFLTVLLNNMNEYDYEDDDEEGEVIVVGNNEDGYELKRRTKNPKAPFLMIVEDADEILTNRRDGDTAAISSLLNMADGIFGSLVDVRIIATTNAKEVEIDKALLRPGRLLEKVSIGALAPERANEVYKRLTGEDGQYTKDKVLSEVYAEAGGFKNKKTETEKKNKIGFC